MHMVFESFSLENEQGLEKSNTGRTLTEQSDASPCGLTLCLPCQYIPTFLLDACSPSPSITGQRQLLCCLGALQSRIQVTLLDMTFFHAKLFFLVSTQMSSVLKV